MPRPACAAAIAASRKTSRIGKMISQILIETRLPSHDERGRQARPYSFPRVPQRTLSAPLCENRLQMLMLETGASEALDETHRKTRSRRLIRTQLSRSLVQDCFFLFRCSGPETSWLAIRSPLTSRALPFGSWINSQVPPCTNFQELPWKSTVDVPWQLVPAPAAQSFCPLSATPKHFSLCAATAASPSAFVRGAAAAMLARALDTTAARMKELMAVFADIMFSNENSAHPCRAHTKFRIVVSDRYRDSRKNRDLPALQRRNDITLRKYGDLLRRPGHSAKPATSERLTAQMPLQTCSLAAIQIFRSGTEALFIQRSTGAPLG